ncbi:DUF4388 domain-containing protein [Sandaracinus amylolyticus]|uniref:DNA-binding response regulator KdpE n=1 Tax=Sandaracinus amylolyticus TaxID=927083 RepID=A0A0F6W4Z5_9BACT|nr:DUF4388 domain-containing protein [Sandaracinus amylolyticus]AKF07625.1 DNA-binding response regulator KdpE [Sandaracinus amylolyticus]
MIPLSVFVVHPDAAIAARIARAVAVAGHAPVMLADGERAIDRFVQEPADVVVVDFFLPGRDGVATIESIRWAPGGRDAHVVLLGERNPESATLYELGRRVGATATLLGPLDDDAIERLVDVLARPPGESTRVASADEIGGQLERLLLPTDAFAQRPTITDAKREDAGDTDEPPAGDDAAAAWPVVETVMANASRAPTREAHHDLEDGGSGVLRRPTSGRLTTPPPAMRTPEITPAREIPPEADAAHAGAREVFADAAALEEGRHVGADARASEEGSQRIMGTFEEASFAALLRRLADQRASGALVCVAEGLRRETTTGDPPTKVVYFRAGVPTHVRSNLLDECLGQILLRRRRIGAATLEESIRRMRLGHGLQGEILIDMGALAPLELGEALADQARDKLFDVFGWMRGTYRFSTKLEPPAGSVGIELGLAEIVYEGVCAAMPATRLFELLSPHLARYLVPDPVQLARFVRVRLVPEARQVLGRVDGKLTLREVLSMGTRPGAVAQLVYAMECLGAVHYAETPGRALRSSETRGLPSSRSVPTPLSAEDATGDDAMEQIADEATEPPHGVLLPPRHAGGEGAGEAWDDATSPARGRVVPDARPGMARGDASGMLATPEHDERREPAPIADEDDETAPPTGLDARVDELFEAERHFRRGNRALDRGKVAEALGAFSKAYEICPDQGEFLAYVGWARHCLAPEDRRSNDAALAELAQARDLSPELHVTHLLHARVLASAGRTAEAHGAYLRVLQIDPGCAEARAAIDALV